MTARTLLRKYKVAIIIAGMLAVVAVGFRAPLVAWFTGEPVGGSYSAPVSTTAGGLQIASSITPDPPEQKGNRFRVELKDGTGKPVDGADVTVTYDMPAMGAMAEMKSDFKARSAGSGAYQAEIEFPMVGSWTMIVQVKAAAASATVRYALTIGSKGLTQQAADGGGIGSMTRGSGGPGTGSDEVAYYTCSMHPTVHAHEPGKCPICSMDLQAVTKADQQAGAVDLDPARQKALGVRTESARRAPMSLDLRAVGKLAYDETRLHDVVLKVGGYISNLRVTATGQPVKQGDTLFEIYSPELYAAEQDYLLARSSRDALGGAGRGDQLVRAAETKLALFGLTRGQIDQIAGSGTPIEKLAFAAPASGYVIEKMIVDGAAIHAGDRVFRIAPLDKVWVEAQVFEHDLPYVAKDQPATVTLSYLPGRTFDGKVNYVYPYLDPTTRTGRVRIELPNPGLELKPEMYANVMFHVPLGDRLQIPSSAILYTGPRKIAIVAIGEGKLVPREIHTGAQSGDRVEVVDGLADGDAVVVEGNFLIAAESRIRASDTFWKESQ
jgi:multidrug efflux pump subunit AcrA (membrane-fusion protein)/nitrogen fixation protein FixH